MSALVAGQDLVDMAAVPGASLKAVDKWWSKWQVGGREALIMQPHGKLVGFIRCSARRNRRLRGRQFSTTGAVMWAWSAVVNAVAGGRADCEAVPGRPDRADGGQVPETVGAVLQTGEWIGREAKDTQRILRGIRDPLADRDERAGPGQHRRDGRAKQRDRQIPQSPHITGISDQDQETPQVSDIA
jgi:hypothetical protein